MPTRNPEARCGNCVYWLKGEVSAAYAHGRCLRFPPIWESHGTDAEYTHPYAEGYDVCGEHPEFLLPEPSSEIPGELPWKYQDVTLEGKLTPEQVEAFRASREPYLRKMQEALEAKLYPETSPPFDVPTSTCLNCGRTTQADVTRLPNGHLEVHFPREIRCCHRTTELHKTSFPPANPA